MANLGEGVWRTVGGRRIFIRTGQGLSDAMKESGKFKNQKSNVGEKKEQSSKSNTIPREYEKITYTQNIDTNAGKKGDKFELYKDEYGETHTKNLRTGETYQANMSMMRSNEAVTINDIVKKETTNEVMNNKLREKTNSKRFPTTLSREIYNMDVDKGNAWSGDAVQKTSTGEQFISVRRNGPSENSSSNIADNIMKKYPQLDAKVISDREVRVTLKKNDSINNSLRQKAYQKYMKEHPNSKKTFAQFKDMNKM